MKSLLSLIASLLAAFCICSCSGHGGGTGPVVTDPIPTGGVVHDFSYTLEGNSMILTPEYPFYSCLGDSVVITMRPEMKLPLEFELDGNTMHQPKTLDTLNSGAVVRWMQNFQREGYGTGLQGDWVRIAGSYRIVSGFPDAAEKMRQDSAIQRDITSLTYRKIRFTLTDTKFSEYFDLEFAAQFVDYWNGVFGTGRTPDAAVYDISLRIVDKYTVELMGLKNMETVRYSNFPNSDRIYTSSNPDNAPLHHYGKPKTCPNPSEPAWYKAFLSANLKAAAPI